MNKLNIYNGHSSFLTSHITNLLNNSLTNIRRHNPAEQQKLLAVKAELLAVAPVLIDRLLTWPIAKKMSLYFDQWFEEAFLQYMVLMVHICLDRRNGGTRRRSMEEIILQDYGEALPYWLKWNLFGQYIQLKLKYDPIYARIKLIRDKYGRKRTGSYRSEMVQYIRRLLLRKPTNGEAEKYCEMEPQKLALTLVAKKYLPRRITSGRKPFARHRTVYLPDLPTISAQRLKDLITEPIQRAELFVKESFRLQLKYHRASKETDPVVTAYDANGAPIRMHLSDFRLSMSGRDFSQKPT